MLLLDSVCVCLFFGEKLIVTSAFLLLSAEIILRESIKIVLRERKGVEN